MKVYVSAGLTSSFILLLSKLSQVINELNPECGYGHHQQTH